MRTSSAAPCSSSNPSALLPCTRLSCTSDPPPVLPHRTPTPHVCTEQPSILACAPTPISTPASASAVRRTRGGSGRGSREPSAAQAATRTAGQDSHSRAECVRVCVCVYVCVCCVCVCVHECVWLWRLATQLRREALKAQSPWMQGTAYARWTRPERPVPVQMWQRWRRAGPVPVQMWQE